MDVTVSAATGAERARSHCAPFEGDLSSATRGTLAPGRRRAEAGPRESEKARLGSMERTQDEGRQARAGPHGGLLSLLGTLAWFYALSYVVRNAIPWQRPQKRRARAG